MYTVGQQLLLLSSMCLFLALLCAFCPSDFILHLLSVIQSFSFWPQRLLVFSVWEFEEEVKVLNIDFQTTVHLPSPPTPSTHFFSSIIFHRPLSNPSKSCALLGYWTTGGGDQLAFINIPLLLAEACDSNYQCHFAAVSAKFSEISCVLILELINMCSIWYSQLEAVLCKINCIYMDIIYWYLGSRHCTKHFISCSIHNFHFTHEDSWPSER